jgi:hypothetical protein
MNVDAVALVVVFVVTVVPAHGATIDRKVPPLCATALDLINRGELADTFLPVSAPSDDDRDQASAFEARTGTLVVGIYDVPMRGMATQRMWTIRQGGTCHSTGLAVPDRAAVSIDERWTAEGADFGTNTAMATIGGESVAIVYQHDRWAFHPIALAHWENRRLTPLCAFAASGEAKRETLDATVDPVCAAFLAGDVEPVAWKEGRIPTSPLGDLISTARHASLAWFGDGVPATTYLLTHESSAGCGMNYHWLAPGRPLVKEAAIDDSSPLARALFPPMSGDMFARGPWIIDAVFTHDGRAWLAGQPQHGPTRVGDYAVYRVERDGTHVQCRYSHLPHYEIEFRGFGADRGDEP